MTHLKWSDENDIILCPLDASTVQFDDVIDLMVYFIVDEN